MPRQAKSARVKPGFNAAEARDIVRMQRDAMIGATKTTQTLARKYKRDPQYLEMRKWVWEQRIEGYSPEEIAARSEDHFGEKITWPRVDAMIESATTDTVEPEAAKLRAVENARLDWYLKCLRTRIEAGDDKAINTALRISERRARMFGIDKPVTAHLHVSGTVDPELTALIAQVRDEQRAELLADNSRIQDAEVVDDDEGYIDMHLPDGDEL